MNDQKLKIGYAQVIWEITRLIQEAESLEGALRTSLGEVVKAVGAEAGTIWFYNSSGDNRIYPSFWIGGADLTGMSLACGEGNTIAWDILRNHAAAFVSCPDWMSARGTRVYGVPMAGDPEIISGESGSVTMGFLSVDMARANYADIRAALKLDENSEVLLVSTEGNTDPVRFREVVWDGLYGIREPFAEDDVRKPR